MRFRKVIRRVPVVLGLGIAIQLSGAGVAQGEVIFTAATLPILGVPYVTSVGAGCFPAAGICISAGSLTLTSVVSATFNSGGEDILANASFAGQLMTTGGAPAGLISLTGTLEQQVLGRTFSTGLGTWTTNLVALSLSGPALGHTLTLGLDGAHTSTGVSSVEAAGIGNDGLFRISSFFDVFVELALDSTPPLTAQRGPLRFEAAPEPLSLPVLMPAGLGLVVSRRRREARTALGPVLR